MICPSCQSSNIYRSHAHTPPERVARTILPVHYYRCHDCDWRGARMQLGIKWTRLARYGISIAYFVLLVAIVLALIGAAIFLVLFRPF